MRVDKFAVNLSATIVMLRTYIRTSLSARHISYVTACNPEPSLHCIHLYYCMAVRLYIYIYLRLSLDILYI